MSQAFASAPLRVGVVGAAGGVGQGAVQALTQLGARDLRLGARDPRALAGLRRQAGARADVHRVDAFDRESLFAFCDGCHIVLNCAGPSYQMLDRVAIAALHTGAHYVDVCGEDPLYDALRAGDLVRDGLIALVSAGFTPGLSGLAVQWLAKKMGQVAGLTLYIGGLDRFSLAGAADYLLGLAQSQAEAGFGLHKGRRGASPSGRTEVVLPFFPAAVTIHPYLSREAERAAAAIGLAGEGAWCAVFGGRKVLQVINQWAQQPDPAHLDQAVADLRRAADFDLVGRRAYQILLLQMQEQTGRARSLVLRTNDVAALTGWIGALAAIEIAEGRIPPGLSYASDVVDGDHLFNRLRGAPCLELLTLLEGEALQAQAEEGAL